ncbi:DNA-binding domain-containing protein [Riemerella anatipestifer]|uniref:DNA-binding domain-containing protein n=1 Tax=Riemerella anatipestifer TaxID=34085 RepID=UPI0028578C2C|nr:DNA-binding domain-containing protein [Riemerella anatipestifer]MDR7808271.1 DNA-binding domain-containing protein [Riemerella anatipestifer]MDR7810163.1 DNA-binding domain-containing protein [Riemerella anatipestifer]MDR7816989.1 DNA-binding domain-containing protein [Riemerella anatipestifer]MDR7822821.1 DNA-binding domain-containing protein [Riemerella anatipestifer]MDR7824719.1 DNA-binding domain-containing protein [Riemerella anatipestifer]
MNTLKAWLRPNLLTKDDPNDFVAVPLLGGSLGITEIIDALKKEGMEIQTETAIDIITRFNRKASELVLNGYSVNTGLVYMRPAIKGVFYDKTWDKEKHSVYVNVNQGTDLRKATNDTKVEILGEQSSPMSVFSITDKATGKADGTLTKGKNAEIKGTYIKIDGDNPKNGIVFKNLDNQNEVKLSAEHIVLNEPSRLLILVPTDLEAGNYELSITTQSSKGTTLLKEPRTETLSTPITIV